MNQYESDQLASLLRSHGLTQVDAGGDVRVVNTCSVTVQAASKSRQTVRRAVNRHTVNLPVQSLGFPSPDITGRSRVLVTGCWATSNPAEAANLPGVDAVLGHHHDVATELDRLIHLWKENPSAFEANPGAGPSRLNPPAAGSFEDDGATKKAGKPQRLIVSNHTQRSPPAVKKKLAPGVPSPLGTRSLPQLGERQSHHQRAYLKIQDGCDAHCTYCIIPQLRPTIWSKPVEDSVREAQALVDAGHREIVLTGIFLGAYGQPTALRRRQSVETAKPLADLVTALCTQVRDLRRLRFSSLEPGDLTADLIARLRSHRQVVPHFHLPLQSGSNALLRRMNRQYTRDDFLRMVDRVHQAFDRPAITTDIIVGFPGETDQEFEQTLDVVDRTRFIHTHAFSFSPRPGTAAARWRDDFIHGPIVNERIEQLNARAREHSLTFRRQFHHEIVEVLVERPAHHASLQHGRCPRYFQVHFEHPAARPGDSVNVRISHVSESSTIGVVEP